MLAYVLRRILSTLPVMGVVVVFVFLLVRLAPGDPAAECVQPTCLDVPPIDVVLVERPWSLGPYGAKGVGEPALIPTAAAIANAVSEATGHRFTRLPLTPERVLTELEAAGRLGGP